MFDVKIWLKYNTSRVALEKSMGVPVKIDANLYAEAQQSGKSSQKSLEAAEITQTNYFNEKILEMPSPFDH